MASTRFTALTDPDRPRFRADLGRVLRAKSPLWAAYNITARPDFMIAFIVVFGVGVLLKSGLLSLVLMVGLYQLDNRFGFFRYTPRKAWDAEHEERYRKLGG